MIRHRVNEFLSYDPLFSRKAFTLRRFNFEWARKVKPQLYYRNIARNFRVQRILFNRFKRKSRLEKWISYSRLETPSFVASRFSLLPLRNTKLGSFFVLPAVRKFFSCAFHIGEKSFSSPTVKKYLFFKRKRHFFFDFGQSVSSYRKVLFFSRLVRRNLGVFHLISTRRSDEIRGGFGVYNSLYAKRMGAYYTSEKWLGGTITNQLQLTLQRKIKGQLPVDPLKYFGSVFYTRKRKKRLNYRVVDSTIAFDGCFDTYARKDSESIRVPSVVSTDTVVSGDDVAFPILFSHASNISLHLYNKILVKAMR